MKYFSLIPVILVFLIFDGGQCSAQLLNVESMRIRTDTTGWFGEVGLSGSYIESESTVLQADARGLIEYKGKKSLILLLENYNKILQILNLILIFYRTLMIKKYNFLCN